MSSRASNWRGLAAEADVVAIGGDRLSPQHDDQHRGGTDDEEFRVAAVKDRAEVTFQVWMGLTMGCAQCHNHKYDPIAQKEYYQFTAFFNQTADFDQPDERPTIAAPTPEMDRQNGEIDKQDR
ncbi:MAG: DUF1549 domain-containing protein [Planctomycetales bacterium]